MEPFDGGSGELFIRAIDGDGCRWYDQGNGWKLDVPYFRNTTGNPTAMDNVAVVDTVNGHREYPISEAGVILIGRRRVGPIRWDH